MILLIWVKDKAFQWEKLYNKGLKRFYFFNQTWYICYSLEKKTAGVTPLTPFPRVENNKQKILGPKKTFKYTLSIPIGGVEEGWHLKIIKYYQD